MDTGKPHFRPTWIPAEGLGVLSLFRLVEAAVPDFFAPDRPIVVTRAPGRLDVMGGFADYSGSLVLQLPTAEAACAALQRRPDPLVRVWSPSRDGTRSQLLSTTLGDLGLDGAPIGYDEARAFFGGDPADRWAGYLLGCLLVLARERGLRPQTGFDLLLQSDVPEGKGVSSSAAIEVAAMRAIAVAYDVALDGRELALLCQKVENEIQGAPCGVMDQMTAACAEADRLMVLRCRPCELEGQVRIPDQLEFVGLDSGVRRGTAGGDYGAVRAGTFVGARLLADEPGWPGWLAALDPADFAARLQPRLPETLAGAEFLRRYGPHVDAHTAIDPARTYAVRAPASHPVAENARAERFRALLGEPLTPAVRTELGELMFAAHAGYTACGLGNPTTDFLIEQVRVRMAAAGAVYGAKVTGGGGGGTVVVLGERGKVWHEVLRLKKALLQHTGHSGHVFRYSSPGAMAFGSLELVPTGD
jgi:galactokinase